MRVGLILFFLLVVLCVPSLYWYAIADGEFKWVPLSSSNQDWAALGSYIGGLLGPIFSAASILFVWWQSKEATANQQEQLNKLNQQLGLEKQQIFRQEFFRLFQRALEEANKEICAGYKYSEIFRKSMHAKFYTQRDLSLHVKPNGLSRNPKKWVVTDDVLEQGWECLQNYLVYVFELADLIINRASEYEMESCHLEPYLRQFKHEFYTGRKEYDLEFINALVTKSDIHGYIEIEKAFAH